MNGCQLTSVVTTSFAACYHNFQTTLEDKGTITTQVEVIADTSGQVSNSICVRLDQVLSSPAHEHAFVRHVFNLSDSEWIVLLDQLCLVSSRLTHTNVLQLIYHFFGLQPNEISLSKLAPLKDVPGWASSIDLDTSSWSLKSILRPNTWL